MRTFTGSSVSTLLTLVITLSSSFQVYGSELSPQQALQNYAASHEGSGCCKGGPCPILEPNATPEEVEKYLRETVQVGSRYNTVGNRWSSTVMTPSTSRGDPIVITYSFVSDGVTIPAISYHSSGPSNLFSALDSQFSGNRSAWQGLFRRVFDDWSKKSGIRYVEVKDDGAGWGSNGQSGVRGDVRIYGIAIPGSVAAYNYYPGSGTGGDMVVDTSYGWNSPGDDFVLFRNMIGHEHAHGFGLGHVTSNNAVMLMEPVLDWSISGGQDDDIRGAQRQYGDTYERMGSTGTGHNNSASTASDLGTLSGSRSWPNASIDDGADVDYYKFYVGSSSSVSVTVAPQGRSYSVGNQGSGESTIDTARIQDLKFDILNSSGSVVKAVNGVGIGGSESTTVSLGSGTYFVRVDDVTGAANVQLYTLSINIGASTTPAPTTPTLTSVTVSPSSASVAVGSSQQLTATARDQNGNPMATQPSFTWSVNGGGTISGSGLFSATGSGWFTVTASGGGKSGTASVTVTSPTNTTRSPYKSIAQIPGTVEAEDFDNGGEGMAYHDSDKYNSGGAYRSSGVDINACSEGGYKVGWMVPGEWLEYTVNVAAAGTYDVEARVSTIYSGKTFHINFDGTNVSGTMTCPNTGDWQRWGSVKASGVTLKAGQQTMRIAIDGDLFNINRVTFTATGTTDGGGGGTGGSGGITPSTIQAEDYRTGGEGTGYHDATGGNSGGKYRQDGVDIETCIDTGGGYNIGYVVAGEWLVYNISASASGSYGVTLRVAVPGWGKSMHLELDGARVGSSIGLPNTGGYQRWTNVNVPNISISAGNHVLKICFDSNDINFNWLSFGGSAVEIGAGNHAPVLGSCGTTVPAALAGQNIGFYSSALDPDNDEVAFAWDFGDGTFAAGTTAEHVYTAPGTYTAVVTADDRVGAWSEQIVTVVVAEAGTGGGSGDENPAEPFSVQRFRAGLNFSQESRDYWRLEATLALPDGFNPDKLPVAIDCAGAVIHAELNAKGSASFDGGGIKLTKLRKSSDGANRRLTVSVRNTEISPWLLAGGTAAGAQGAAISVKLNITLGGTTYSATFDGTYSGKEGKTGKVY